MSVLPTTGPGRRRILTPYVMIWMAIASFALAYLALLGLKPHMFASTAKSAAEIDQKIAQTRLDMERGLADLDPLRRTVGTVKMDVDNLKVAVEEASVRDQVLMEKVTALETGALNAAKAPERAKPATAAVSPPVAIPPTPKKKAGGQANFAPPVGPSAEAIKARAQESARVINSNKGSDAIETGSIKRNAVAVPAAAKPAPVGLLLAKGPTIDTLRLNWSILTDRHPDAVRNLHPRYVVNGKASNRTYGLVVGPVASTAEAKTLCKVMESKGLPCEVSTYRGNAL
jgi:hypothetical protein